MVIMQSCALLGLGVEVMMQSCALLGLGVEVMMQSCTLFCRECRDAHCFSVTTQYADRDT